MIPSIVTLPIHGPVLLEGIADSHRETCANHIQQCQHVLLVVQTNSIATSSSPFNVSGMNYGNLVKGTPRGTFKPFAPTTVLVMEASNL